MKFRIPFIPHLTIHVSDNNLYDCSGKCPVCMSKELRASIAVIQKNPMICLLKCNQCHGISASHMPISSFLQSYYENNFNKIYKQYDTNKKITFHDEQRFAKHICRYIDTDWAGRQKLLRIIDFGGGDGTLAAEVATKLNCRARITVVDHGPEWIREGSICIEREQFVESIHQRCHIVIASASIEHVPQPRPVIQKLYSLMEPGGYFYARTPFVSPFMGLLDIFDFGYPAHLHDLGPAFWNSFAHVFANDAACVVSQPSIVETCFTKSPVKTIIAAAFKLPAHLEIRIRPASIQPFWQFVGGWEAIFRKNLQLQR